MIIFHKLAIYTVKLMAKPFISGIQKRHTLYANKTESIFARCFIKIGQWNHYLNSMLNKRILGVKTDSDMFLQPINREVALAKGVEIFWSGFLYSFLIVISFYEYNKYAKEAETKK